jgi:uncharacterized protein YcfJ
MPYRVLQSAGILPIHDTIDRPRTGMKKAAGRHRRLFLGSTPEIGGSALAAAPDHHPGANYGTGKGNASDDQQADGRAGDKGDQVVNTGYGVQETAADFRSRMGVGCARNRCQCGNRENTKPVFHFGSLECVGDDPATVQIQTSIDLNGLRLRPWFCKSRRG